MKDKVSIIMPAYNAAGRIEKSIRKIEQQSYTNFELIIVNDGSKDTTEEVCRLLAEEYSNIKLISQENAGPGKAREKGVQFATGDIIAFVDSDDYLAEGALQVLVSKMEETNADILQFGYKMVNNNGDIISDHLMSECTFESRRDAYQYFITQKNSTNFLCNKVYKYTLFHSIEWPGIYYSEDYAVLAQLYGKTEKAVTIKDKLYYYVQHPESAVNRPFSRRKLDQITAAKYVIKYTRRNFAKYLPEALYYLATRAARLADEVMYSDLAEKKQIYNDLIRVFNMSYSEMRLLLKKQRRKIDIDKTTKAFAISPRISRLLKRLC